MTIPVTGALAFDAINTEVGLASGTQVSINDSSFRDLTGTASGQISLNGVYGTTYPFVFYGSSGSVSLAAHSNAANTLCSTKFYINFDGTLSSYFTGTDRTDSLPTGYHNPTTTGIASRYQYRFLQTGWTKTGGSSSFIFGEIDPVFGQRSSYSPTGGNIDTGWLTLTNSNSYREWDFWQSQVSVPLGVDATMSGTFYMRRAGQITIIKSVPFSFRVYYA
jgi:hypothetical protein